MTATASNNKRLFQNLERKLGRHAPRMSGGVHYQLWHPHLGMKSCYKPGRPAPEYKAVKVCGDMYPMQLHVYAPSDSAFYRAAHGGVMTVIRAHLDEMEQTYEASGLAVVVFTSRVNSRPSGVWRWYPRRGWHVWNEFCGVDLAEFSSVLGRTALVPTEVNCRVDFVKMQK